MRGGFFNAPKGGLNCLGGDRLNAGDSSKQRSHSDAAAAIP